MSEKRHHKTQKRYKSQDVTGTPVSRGMAVTLGASMNVPLAKNTNAAANNLFQLLSDDIIAHILSYRIGLRIGRVKPAKTAMEYYRDAKHDEWTRAHPEISYIAFTMLNWQFKQLNETEQEPWLEMARRDQERHDNEEAALVGPDRLFGIINGLALVSKQWYNVVGRVMNKSAPFSIISSQQLFELKCRALSMDLSSVCRTFLQVMRREWGNECIEDAEDDLVTCHNVVEVLLDDYGTVSFVNDVTTEYVKFLVVKSVETLATQYGNMHGSCSTSLLSEVDMKQLHIWREACEVTNLLQLFWQAHVQDKEKYAADCRVLVGDLLPDDERCTENKSSLIGYDVEHSYPQDGCDYMSKRNTLFQFEKQLFPRNFLFGRLGDDLNKKRRLLSHEFDIHAVARNILMERESQQYIQD